jgi:acetyl esterase/lipase
MTKLNFCRIHLILAMALFFGCGEKDDNLESGPLPFRDPPAKTNSHNLFYLQDYPYGSSPRATMDVWLPASTSPTPLVIFVHGGGFTGGDKSFVLTAESSNNSTFIADIDLLLDNGIAVASINYELLDTENEQEGVIKCLTEIKRSVQFFRRLSSHFNIDEDKIAMVGQSAGAGAALWLAAKDDMADAEASDPVLRESTRLAAAVLLETQSTYDIVKWFTVVYNEYQLTPYDLEDAFLFVSQVRLFYGISDLTEVLTPPMAEYRQNLDMLSMISSDDPPLYIENVNINVAPPSNVSMVNHHAFHAQKLHLKAQEVGIETVCYYGKNPLLYQDPTSEDYVSFLIRVLTDGN